MIDMKKNDILDIYLCIIDKSQSNIIESYTDQTTEIYYVEYLT